MSGSPEYSAQRAAAFFDDYGEREWTRFEDGRTPSTSVTTHVHYLQRYIAAGQRVLDIGCGPGRFTIALAEIGAEVVAADVSQKQLDLHERFLEESGHSGAVVDRILSDVLDLSAFDDDTFDAVVCFGGPVSYVLEEAPQAIAELVRVTRPGGHVLLSVMALVGATINALSGVAEIATEHGDAAVDHVISSGVLPTEYGGHLPMKLYRWRELQALLQPHGEIVAASATGLFPDATAGGGLAERLERELGAEPGAIDAGRHILAVVRV